MIGKPLRQSGGNTRRGHAGERGPVSVPGYNAGMNGINLLFVALAAFVLVVLVFYIASHA